MVKAGGGGYAGRLACTRSRPSSSCLGEQLCPRSTRLSIKYSCSKPKSGYFSVLDSLEVVGPQLSPRPGLAQFFSLSLPVESSLFSTKCQDSFLLPQRPLSPPWVPVFMPPSGEDARVRSWALSGCFSFTAILAVWGTAGHSMTSWSPENPSGPPSGNSGLRPRL